MYPIFIKLHDDDNDPIVIKTETIIKVQKCSDGAGSYISFDGSCDFTVAETPDEIMTLIVSEAQRQRGRPGL